MSDDDQELGITESLQPNSGSSGMIAVV